jgi:hypothetical protein
MVEIFGMSGSLERRKEESLKTAWSGLKHEQEVEKREYLHEIHEAKPISSELLLKTTEEGNSKLSLYYKAYTRKRETMASTHSKTKNFSSEPHDVKKYWYV